MIYSPVVAIFLLFMPYLIYGITYPNCPIDVTYTNTIVASRTVSYSRRSSTSCGFFGWGRCTVYRTKYKQETYLVTETKLRTKDACCAGKFIGIYPNCIPQCYPACVTQNGGKCRYNARLSKNYCECRQKGWTGESCNSDVNECTASSNICHRLATCENTDGGYDCNCQSGLELDATNRYTCIDINECTTGQHTCHSELYCKNTLGGYACDCPSGYQVNPSNPQRCLDINECTEEYAFGGCEQNCTNTPGFFKCLCDSGYQTHWYDFRKCKDIDECKWNLDDCDDLCFNSRGSYECGCRQGCELNHDKKTCDDIDECALGISACSQNCTNKHCFNGQYSCSCYDGYELDEDKKNCKNLNECSNNNGGCEHNCTDTEGSYECSCKMGYTLREDQYSCQAVLCETLESPIYGSTECTNDNPVFGDSCKFSCDEDYVLSGSESRDCLSNTSWSGETSMCSIVQCPTLVPSEHSRIISRCSMDLNSSCILTCESDYYMEGSTVHTQTCKYNGENKTEPLWSAPPDCKEINACDPNPCENEGVCSPLDDNTPSCSCPNSNVKGDLCEQTIVEVDDMPILEQNKWSDPISIRANPTTIVYITIIVDSTIKVLPLGSISITSPASSASFQLLPSVEGIFEISYKITTKDQLIPPDNQILVISNSGANDIGYYTGLNAPVRGLSPGCCRISPLIVCHIIYHSISLSSSCSWSSTRDRFKTSGVVFAHINSLSLPLSIAGIEFRDTYSINQISQGEFTCSRCSLASSDTCFDYLPNIHDIGVLIEKQAFVDQFYQSISSILPPLISMKLLENENRAELHASIISGRDVLMVDGCKGLDVHISKTYHVLTTKQGLEFSYMNEHISVYENHDALSSLCFATDICDIGLIHVGGLTQGANNQLSTLPSLETFHDWNIEFKYFSLFRSQQNYPGKHQFWDGNVFFTLKPTKFNIKTTLNAMGDFTSSHLLVNFMFQGDIHSSTVSDAYCHKEFNGEISASINMDIGGVPSVLTLLSSNGDGYLKSCLGSSFSEASALLMFSPKHSSNEVIDFLYSQEECKVNAYMKYDNALSIENISLQSKCMAMKFEGLEFNNMNTIVDIDSQMSPVGDGVESNVIVKSSVDSPTSLGTFITVYPMDGANVQFTVFSNVPGKFGIIQNANLSLFESNYASNILISSHQDASFEIDDGVMYSHYPVAISGMIDTQMPWDEIRMSIDIKFLKLNAEIQIFVKEQLEDEADIALSRLKFCNDSKQHVMNKIAKLENKQLELENNLTEISDQLESKLNEQAQAEFKKEQIHNRTVELFEEYKNLIDSVKNDESICTIEPCDKVCKGSVFVTRCFTPIEQTQERDCSKSVMVQKSITESITLQKTRCDYKRSCSNPKEKLIVSKVGVALTLAGVVAANPPLIVVGVIIAGFGSLFGRSCGYKCFPVMYEEIEYQPKFVSFEVLKPDKCKYTSVVGYDNMPCNYTSSCGSFTENVTCINRNKVCVKNKANILENLLEENDTRDLLRGSGDIYQEATDELTEISYEITLIQIDKADLDNELNETASLLEAAENSKTIVSQSCVQIEEDVKTGIIVDGLIKSKSLDNLLVVNSAISDLSFSSETPVIFPIDIKYNIPYLSASYVTSVTVDMSSAKDIVIETIGLSLKDELISTFTGSHGRRKRDNQQTITDYFATKCDSLEDILSYLQFVVGVLSESQETAANIITSLSKEQIEASDSLNELLSSDIINDNSNFSEIVITGETRYTEKYVAIIDRIAENLDNSIVSNWQTLMENVHSNISSVANRSCFTFADCLVVSASEINYLLSKMPTKFVNKELYFQMSVISNLSSVATSTSTDSAEISDIINDAIMVLNEISNIGYWCATTPNILVNPASNTSVRRGDSFTLLCEANSTLPITYRWRRNGKYIIKQYTNALLVSNAQISDNGIYHCETSNSVGTSKTDAAIISVFEIPQLNNELSSLTTFVGASFVQFVCDVSGYPELEYTWFFASNNTASLSVLAGQINSSLIISDVKSSDEGWYKCQATNLYGAVTSKRAQLLIVPSENVKLLYNFKSDFTINSTELLTSDEDTLHRMVYNWYNAIIGNSNVSISDFTLETISNNTLSINFAISTQQKELETTNVVDSSVQEIELLEKAKYNLAQVLASPMLPFHLANISYTILSFENKLISYKFQCTKGYEFDGSNYVCVSCSPGTFWDRYVSKIIQPSPGDQRKIHYSICSPCPIGDYQDQSGSIECNRCPMNHTSVVEGSKNVEDCKETCKPGTYSHDGYCDNCEIGYYQLERGKTFCSPCSNSTINDQCLSVLCGVDHFSENGMKPCNKCIAGEEQPLIGKTGCIGCNVNSTSPLCQSVLTFEKNSPIVSDTNTTVYLRKSNLKSLSCYVSHIGEVNCSSGVFVLTNLVSYQEYEITLSAIDILGKQITVKRKVYPKFPEQCSVHLINNGITIHEDRVVVEFAAVGVDADGSARCGINLPLSPCKSPVVFNNVNKEIRNLLIIIPNTCPWTHGIFQTLDL